eukprot:TRINITY_DN11348_c0_g1_i1.p1 TRINITY_DN11348_c0_g1~~TRINITY_DN11348_c0_g1_i1.p1  ORF type:complete len:146 (-),score=39.44 TRINITY_DN11348_c0_g1_i1:51-464(-)
MGDEEDEDDEDDEGDEDEEERDEAAAGEDDDDCDEPKYVVSAEERKAREQKRIQENFDRVLNLARRLHDQHEALRQNTHHYLKPVSEITRSRYYYQTHGITSVIGTPMDYAFPSRHRGVGMSETEIHAARQVMSRFS